MSETKKDIHIELFTKRSEDTFLEADVYVNDSGNICIYLDEVNYAVVTPLMAKRLSLRLDEASRTALAKHISE